MTGDKIDRTIVSNSAAPPVADSMAAGVSRAEVGFVVGDRPKFADETASLLRSRLLAAALALTVILGAAFVGNLLGGTFSFWWLRLTILLLLAACWMVLRSNARCH